MEQRLSLVTLGVSDLDRAERFYAALGWERGNDDDEVAFFQCGGMVVALWDRGALAEDSAVEDNGGWGGVTLALNLRSPAEVDEVLDQAEAAGAVIGRRGAETSWGGYYGDLHRPRRPPVGGRPQPVLDGHRRRPHPAPRLSHAAYRHVLPPVWHARAVWGSGDGWVATSARSPARVATGVARARCLGVR